MKFLKRSLFVIGVAPLVCFLMVIPLIGILHASAAAIGGFAFLGILIALQWPMFRLLRRYLPERADE